MSTLSFIYHKIVLNPVVLSLISGFIGALVGGIFSCLVTELAHIHNRKLKDDELKLYEKATALSIVEELKVIKDLYDKTFDEQFSKLSNRGYVNYLLNVNPECSTVFNQNASEIGLIKNKELRNLIIKTNLQLKKFIESVTKYNVSSNQHAQNRRDFMSSAYPNMISVVSSQDDVDSFVDSFIKKFVKEYPKIVEESKMTEAQLVSFVNNEKATLSYLCKMANALKTEYYNLKNNIELTINKANELYGE